MFSRNVLGRILNFFSKIIFGIILKVFLKLFLKYIQIECRKYIFEEKLVFENALN